MERQVSIAAIRVLFSINRTASSTLLVTGEHLVGTGQLDFAEKTIC